MSRHNSTGAFQGFSVVQPTLGAALQWLPALGTQELDDMINAFLPGPSSIQDKRAHISMDFFEYSRQTGETFKFYPVSSKSFASATTASPASSAGLYDSGYGSNFNVSPVVASDSNLWTQSPVTYAPSVSFSETNARSPRSSTSRRPAASSSRQQTTDFSNHPGMRIMTKDGRDVTNSASRGCKSKEQRDHAHLMRIIKACDACKRKKIRCDPSHKKRPASQASPVHSEQKPTKKSKKQQKADPPPVGINEFSLDFLTTDDLEIPQTTSSFPPFEASSESLDQLWDQFVQEDSGIFTTDFTDFNYDFFNDPLGYVTPSTGSSSASPSQVFTPYTPAPPGPSPTVVVESVPELVPSDPAPPYLNPGVPHGTDYVDFNLYSPPADFFLDEEPLPLKRSSLSEGRRPLSAQSRSAAAGQPLLNTAPLPVSSVASRAEGTSSSSSDYLQWSPVGVLEDAQFFGLATSSSQLPSPHVTNRVPHRWSVIGQELAVEQQHRDPDRHGPDRTPLHVSDEQYCAVRSGVSSRPQYSLASSENVVSTAPVLRISSIRVGPVVTQVPDGVSPAATVDIGVSSSSTRPSPSLASQVSAVSPQALVSASSPSETSLSYYGNSRVQTTVSHGDVAATSSLSVIARAVESVGVDSSHHVDVGDGVPANHQQSPSGWQRFVRYRSDGQPGLVSVPGVGEVVGSPFNAFLATNIDSSLPVRRILAGEDVKLGQASSPSSVVSFSQLVVLGLVSYLLACILSTQFMGGLTDLLDTLVIKTTISLASLATLRRSTARTPLPIGHIGNVKSKIQDIGMRFSNFGCTVRQRAGLFARRMSSAMPSMQSLGLS
ncbi:hypothetical protein B0H66DRAFT_91945 [Apodospora peruviana]|uniref:Zn(2)-C6 fungal-type domain-containing protein n=1 Tax=Apodospora peruviana TaxID=516989 RepID=A0AAE0IUG4_9PEZI|nr:hypothetical protein B0H66DRAFT_91945 [Apodospora peruviana]